MCNPGVFTCTAGDIPDTPEHTWGQLGYTQHCLCNPGVFTCTDTCYVLSFAVIMLNTSLHNPNVRDKPSAERFVAMNRGINDGGDLPEELLRNLYESIRSEPFKIPEDDGNDLTHTFFNPDREGWLLKLGGRVKTWKRRWFILTDNCLYYFEYTTDKEPRGIIPLENLSIREVEDPRKPHCFELYIPNSKGQLIKACKTEAPKIPKNPQKSPKFPLPRTPKLSQTGSYWSELVSHCFELYIPNSKGQLIKASLFRAVHPQQQGAADQGV
ncbi:cytohesin-2-like [Malurus melanocephalus]|uniref:cytohesin-2-like n=1 Tax=Malurus melanocephalus TaxID=175006 RepID=UPI002546A6E8|nr:cytohesin-2-like [Malurus melanocephalus]